MHPNHLNIRHLLALPIVVRSGSISVAARAVNLTQPAITQGIAKLERQIGMALFDRVPGLLIATPAAHLLAERAENALRFLGNRRATAAQIRAFVALAQHGSYAAAAGVTGLAEASLHRAVADLSLTLGVRLVDRRGRGVVLTRRGEEIARNFRLALAELRSGRAEIAALQGREVGHIAVGAMPLSRARLLPNAIATFLRDNAQVDFAVAEGSHAELIGPLRDGDIDMMIGALRDDTPGADLVQMALFTDQPVILARSGHPLAHEAGRLAPADLACFPWIMAAEGTPLRSLWQRMFALADVSLPKVPIECGSVITIRQLLGQTDFLTMLSPDQVAVELEAGWLVQLGVAPGAVSRTIGLTTRADWRPTPLQQAFMATLIEEAGKMRPVSGNSY
ncbi:LysR family transcriptional regulator [Novosphingobium sp. Leaf2]|uniref:LysR family transcriptional regulator n=1 Tax=Novosphingobium sp. Leaf2 TaxID=1735670 RepID=UPI000700F0F3|nr:LysR family transcriptional regulator [Novosphingobium sp. Leaf2]KQM20748.1 LysR family transcriptional regulator [Novosphingobium sp. Leaf2]